MTAHHLLLLVLGAYALAGYLGVVAVLAWFAGRVSAATEAEPEPVPPPALGRPGLALVGSRGAQEARRERGDEHRHPEGADEEPDGGLRCG